MKLNCMQVLLITCLCASAASAVAQTSTPVTLASKESSGDPLPYAPSAVSQPAPSVIAPISVPVTRDKYFMLANGLMFSSSIANVELTSRCFSGGACAALPGPFRSRGALYGVGLPVDLAVAVMSYRLKRSEHRWWFVPAAAVTAGNIIYSVHAIHYTH
jgi:hypothetical protein